MTNREAHEEAAGMNLDPSFFTFNNIDPDAEYQETQKVDQKQLTEIIQAFTTIEKSNLKINTIVCSICGCVVNFKNKDPICSHLKNQFSRRQHNDR